MQGQRTFQRSARTVLLLAVWAYQAHAQGEIPRQFPANNATDVNPDTQLVLTFASPPTIGTSGVIRIFDATDNSLVDSLDMSIPASPYPSGRAPPSTEAERRARAAAMNMSDFQVNTVGGVDFHFFPIIVRGNRATVYPHNNKLKYGRKYRVQMDPGVLKTVHGDFAGFSNDAGWTFTTKTNPPPADTQRVVVAADGHGDFNTVQGAIDFAPVNPSRRLTIFIKAGNYEELVYINGKTNLTIRGEDRANGIVGYPNNSAFNPPRAEPSRRPAFSIQNGTDIQLSSFTINNYFTGQAEALLVRGERIVLDCMTLNGSGDALTTYGTIYMVDSKLTGHGDTILAYAALFCLRCEIQSSGPFTWTRTPQGSHGNVFVDSTFIALDEPKPWAVSADGKGDQRTSHTLARLPRNSSRAPNSQVNFPYAEMVLINSRMDGIPAEGWGPIEEAPAFDSSNVRFLEFNTKDMQGRPIDVSQRHPVSRQLQQPRDAKTIANYSTPEFVLSGWRPVVNSPE